MGNLKSPDFLLCLAMIFIAEPSCTFYQKTVKYALPAHKVSPTRTAGESEIPLSNPVFMTGLNPPWWYFLIK